MCPLGFTPSKDGEEGQLVIGCRFKRLFVAEVKLETCTSDKMIGILAKGVLVSIASKWYTFQSFAEKGAFVI